ncbi:MAG: VanZ family protein [Muribaculaceae bacterium]|nr:VanZ family protein [Muribaculaceae bacterium]
MRKILSVIPVGFLSVIAIAIIAYLSLSSDPLGASHMHLFKHSDKVAHFLMYFMAACAFITDYAKFKLPHHTKINKEMAFTASAMLLGLIMEVLQLVMGQGRSYSNVDIVINCLGALAGLGYMKWRGLHHFRNIMLHSHRGHRHGHHHHKSKD